MLATLAVLLALHKPWALMHPQLWAEDGSIFLAFNDLHGLRAFAEPYMGYLHTIPRLIAWIVPHLLDPAWWPAFYNWSAFLVSAAVVARTFSRRLDLPGKAWLALAFFLGPQTGEVFFTITNIQWFTAILLVEQAFIAPPINVRERLTDLAIVVLVGLTGPFVIAFCPLLVWRWWNERTVHNLVIGILAAGCALIQGILVLRTGPHFDWPPFSLARFYEIIGQHLFGWPLVGHELAVSLPPAVIGALGIVATLFLVAHAMRPGPYRNVRGILIAGFVLLFAAIIYRARPDTWDTTNLEYGERYFYVPRLLLFWLLILEFDAPQRWVRWTARVVALWIVLVNLRHYVVPAQPDYHWAAHCEPIRKGIPADIPILPEGWTLEYRGRPQPR